MKIITMVSILMAFNGCENLSQTGECEEFETTCTQKCYDDTCYETCRTDCY